MRKIHLIAAALVLSLGPAPGRESTMNTWSVVAVDPRSREVAGAGASCVPDASILVSTIRNVGAAATQAFYSSTNQLLVEQRMQAGDSPQAIIDFVNAPDVNRESRQYGIVTLAHGAANFTGTAIAIYWSGAASAPYVTVQGNLLAGPAVVNDALAAFQNPEVPLVDRLLAALQAGQRAGGDVRCTHGADSAFLRIVRAEDGGTPYCDLRATIDGNDPIAALAQQVFAWKQARAGQVDAWNSSVTLAPATVQADGTAAATLTVTLKDASGSPLAGRVVTASGQGMGSMTPFSETTPGAYTATVTSTAGGQETFTIQAGGVTLGERPVATYTSASSEDGGRGCGLLGLEALAVAALLLPRKRLYWGRWRVLPSCR